MVNKLDLSKIPKEVMFILELLKDDEGKNYEAFKDTDWDLFIDYAIHHRVYPLLYVKVKNLDKVIIPSSVIQTLAQLYKKNTMRMLLLTAEMEQISKVLTENAIDIIFLKGPVVAQDLYGDLSLRTSTDLDFLIPIEKLDETEKLLVEQGYKKTEEILSIFKEWRWRHHHVSYFHPEKQLKVEIHWRLAPGPGKEPEFRELWQRKQLTNLTKYPVYFLGLEDLFVFLVNHGARHGWFRLRWLIDIRFMLKKPLNWKEINKLFKKIDYMDVGGQSIILASELLHITNTFHMENILKRKRPRKLAELSLFFVEKKVTLHSDSMSEEISKYYKKYLFSLRTTPQKIIYLLSRLTPGYSDEKTFPLPRWLYFLYYPLRPFLVLWRTLNKPSLL